jgi:hypothetical protein
VPFTSAQWGSLASFGAKRWPGTKKYYGTLGNSFVAVVEFGDKVRARAVSAGGESGDPASPHFNDQAMRYSLGNLRDVYFYPEDVKGHIGGRTGRGSRFQILPLKGEAARSAGGGSRRAFMAAPLRRLRRHLSHRERICPLDIPAHVRRRARRTGHVDAALGLVLPGPAAGADVLALFRRLGAGPAADRGEALGDQRVGRQVVLGDA